MSSIPIFRSKASTFVATPDQHQAEVMLAMYLDQPIHETALSSISGAGASTWSFWTARSFLDKVGVGVAMKQNGKGGVSPRKTTNNTNQTNPDAFVLFVVPFLSHRRARSAR